MHLPGFDPHSESSRNLPHKGLPPSIGRIPRVEMAKWPPDDDGAPPGSHGGGVPSYSGGDDGNFKRGRFAPAAILIGILAAGGVAAAIVLGSMKDSEKMDPKKVA